MSYAKVYDPITVGTINGDSSQTIPHDHAILRAQKAIFHPPSKRVTSTNALKTLFIARLNYDTTEASVTKLFERYGKLTNVTLIYNCVTGLSEGYGFVTFERTYAAKDAYRDAHGRLLDNHRILVDYEHGRTMKGWIPRRLGGGFGGKKESGQLRFGARDRPFRSLVSSDHTKKKNHTSSSDRHQQTHSKRKLDSSLTSSQRSHITKEYSSRSSSPPPPSSSSSRRQYNDSSSSSSSSRHRYR
ncbi:uncharacterized protein BX664DRAFT_384155 [Halteromyces radiatus]|uniref:uncharacterized protein n=1 Tax=Halteromyces radiatus TaxID=101107 RepID=UPI002220F8F7|nr:uncharacterized protein BX664DRAFT_384155 [Halteromyces radiatus]KAI8092611.1 hypothetical protein BX664DRAFT_384155 [Halteromyces radiatus]